MLCECIYLLLTYVSFYLQNPVRNHKQFKVALITDAHIDPLYEAYGVADCDVPTCCRVGQSPARRFSYRSTIDESLFDESVVYDDGEVKLNLTVAKEIRKERMSRSRYQYREPSPPAGYWGDYRNCDTPIWAFDDAVEHIHETHKVRRPKQM